MSIDVRARAAADEARRSAERTVNPAAMLRDLHRIRRRRRAVAMIGSVAVVTAVISGAALLAAHTPDHKQAIQPATPKTPSPATSTTPRSAAECAQRRVQCLGNDSFRVSLRVPVTFSLPANFIPFQPSAPTVLDLYRSDVNQTGVSVIEDATPVKDDATWSRDPAAGTHAESIATWLKNRPFLTHSTLTRTTIGELPAWRVSAQLKPGARLPAPKAGFGSVAPTFIGGFATLGYRPGFSAEYTLLDVPGAGVTVIWSWSVNHGKRALTDNRAFINSMSFD